jgi:hypothetical protein
MILLLFRAAVISWKEFILFIYRTAKQLQAQAWAFSRARSHFNGNVFQKA